MTRSSMVVLLFLCTSPAFAQLVAELPIDVGAIAIRNPTDQDRVLAGVALTSSNDGLIPIADTGTAEPFDFILSNTPSDITLGTLGTFPTMAAGACIVLDAGVEPDAEFSWLWGEGSNVAQPFERVETVCAVPESNATCSCCLGVCVMFLLYRNRTSVRPRSNLEI